ncbi:oxygen-independent coproporphyrinogen III oxidase [Cognatishimia sp. SS12]|uniref:oxygen-independent coproporphyrinogen III oxidase n=1 Tax=Cognatishimia sp. SS12 TaxID=2979465 RepID=UPI00232F2E39|nr:oxygen-independent coproporphyrinogen III oxidase [Cognatishimia sp. SS12]MDC0739145.1 oxygen-independent coproporphyrinogen III oxidase [Cognatishimia sp. SS12]
MTLKTQFADLGLFDAKVPRYTSYPTAPHFTDAVTPGHFVDWISKIKPGSQVSLYVHVPFCKRLCWFCACRTQGTKTMSPVGAYVETLKAELALLKSHLPENVTLSRLHWGGGTPTLLTPEMMQDLADAIFAVAPLAPDGEFSVEIDPNEIDAARFAALAGAGMNRASIGVQDFDEKIQQAIGRIQDFDTTRAAIEMARAHGIKSVNADILFGLPHQSPARMTDSVLKLLSLNPDRVALYGYAHVPWMSKRQQLIPSASLPTPQERLALFELAERLFLADGYKAIGIDHFAAPSDGLAQAQKAGKLRRNFQGYTDDQADVLIGVGASSISRFPQGFAQNAPATSAHIKAIEAGEFSVARGHVFSGDDRLNARLIEAIMCDFGINAEEILANHDITAPALRARFDAVNRQFDGLLEVDDSGLRIPDDVRPLTRIVARAFDAYDLSKAGHSSAI